MFDKWEEKEVNSFDFSRLMQSKDAKLVRALANGKYIVRIKKRKERATEEEVPREKVPGKLQYEIVREKDSRNIIVKKGKVDKRKEHIDFKKRRFYINHIVKETIGDKVRYFVRWNLYYSEALDPIHKTIPEYDSSLESRLMNDQVIQLGKAAAAAAGFILEQPMIILLILAFTFGIPIGLSYNDLFHLVPNTQIHWVPRR